MDTLLTIGLFGKDKMPDTKNGIRHLTNVASMHHNMFVQTQRLYSKQFKAAMRVHTKDINFIKDQYTKLQVEKDKYKKDDEHLRQVMNLDVEEMQDDPDMDYVTHSEKFEIIKQHQHKSTRAISEKVRTFNKEQAARSKSAPATRTNDESMSISTKELLSSKLILSPQQGSLVKPINTEKPKPLSGRATTASHVSDGQSRNHLERVDEEDEYSQPINDVDENTQPIKIQDTNCHPIVTPDTIFTPRLHCVKNRKPPSILPFQNDRYVNSAVNSARSKLLALYQFQILGPQSRMNALYSRTEGLKPQPPTSPKKSGRSRAQSSQGFHTTKEQKQKNLRRNISSAHPRLINQEDMGIMSIFPGYEEQEHKAEKDHQIRQNKLEEFRRGLSDQRFQRFQEALARRMTIRNMRAAEYDAAHDKTATGSIADLMPVKTVNLSAEQQRVSALMALEKSFLGGAQD